MHLFVLILVTISVEATHEVIKPDPESWGLRNGAFVCVGIL